MVLGDGLVVVPGRDTVVQLIQVHPPETASVWCLEELRYNWYKYILQKLPRSGVWRNSGTTGTSKFSRNCLDLGSGNAAIKLVSGDDVVQLVQVDPPETAVVWCLEKLLYNWLVKVHTPESALVWRHCGTARISSRNSPGLVSGGTEAQLVQVHPLETLLVWCLEELRCSWYK